MGQALWEGFLEEVGLGNWEEQAGSERRGVRGGEDSPCKVWQWEYRNNRLTYKGAEDQVEAD